MQFERVLSELTPLLFNGLGTTVWISVLSLFIAFFIGMISCLFAISKLGILKAISKFYVWIIRGTPFLVQLFIIKYGFPQLVQLVFPDFKLGIVAASVISLCLNAGAYMSEIFRGAILAVDPGQMEAARSLGLPHGKAMLKVILPQALKISIPTLCNQLIITIKDSSMCQIIGLQELFYNTKIYVGSTFRAFESYLLVACFYLFIITILSFIIKRIERSQQHGTTIGSD